MDIVRIMDIVYSTINFTQHALPYWVSLTIYILLYFLPTFIAVYRDARMAMGAFLLNLFFGITGIGWFVALIMAFIGPKGAEAGFFNRR